MKTKVAYAVGSESLQTIVIISLKTLSTYEDLVKNTQNTYILDWLSKKVKYTSKFILEVQVQLESMGLEPHSLSKFEIFANKIRSGLKSIFTRIDDEFIIRECLQVDFNYLNSLSQVKTSTLITDDLYQIYSKQIERISQKPSAQIKSQNFIIG